MQYNSRIHIKVTSPEVWKRFVGKEDAGLELADLECKSFVVEEAAWMEEELFDMLTVLSETLGSDGLIIADVSVYSSDPVICCVYYLGESVQKRLFSSADEYEAGDCEEGEETMADLIEEISISDMAAWLERVSGTLVSEAEREQLFRCGIVERDGLYYERSLDFGIPDKVYLRETSFENRSEAIEKCALGEKVFLRPAYDHSGTGRLEVFRESGSLGYLPSDVCDYMTPYLQRNSLIYTARIVELVKLSQRNPHAKSSIVAIHIDVEKLTLTG